MPLSHSKPLYYLAQSFVPILLGFGLNSIFRPQAAYQLLGELPTPSSTNDTRIVNSLMILYGAKELVQALGVFLVGSYGSKRALGWMVLASCAGAFVDGWVVKDLSGGGEWNHWGYGSLFSIVGVLLTGILD